MDFGLGLWTRTPSAPAAEVSSSALLVFGSMAKALVKTPISKSCTACVSAGTWTMSVKEEGEHHQREADLRHCCRVASRRYFLGTGLHITARLNPQRPTDRNVN